MKHKINSSKVGNKSDSIYTILPTMVIEFNDSSKVYKTIEWLKKLGFKIINEYNYKKEFIEISGTVELFEKTFNIKVNSPENDIVFTWDIPKPYCTWIGVCDFSDDIVNLYQKYREGDIVGNSEPPTKEEWEETKKAIEQARTNWTQEQKLAHKNAIRNMQIWIDEQKNNSERN